MHEQLETIKKVTTKDLNSLFYSLQAPSAFSASFTALDAMEKALDMEIEVNESLLRMHKHAANDPAVSQHYIS